MSTILKVYHHIKKTSILSTLQVRLQHTETQPNLNLSQQSTVPVFRKAIEFYDRIALQDTVGKYTYTNLFLAAKELASEITKNLNGKTNRQVLFLCSNDANYIITQWAIWMSGQVAVPVSPLHPQNMLEYYTKDCDGQLLITSPTYAETMHKVAKSCGKNLIVLDENLQKNALSMIAEQSNLDAGQPSNFYTNNDNNCMIVYTSGTTGNPKGVVLTHKGISLQVNTLIDAWRWTANDVILHVLPLHHIHGIVNALLCPLYIGAKCNMIQNFDANTVWSYLLGVNANADYHKITVFMAVPTIYAKLIEEYEKVFSKDPKMVEYIEVTLKSKVRLMVSGSAPLPVPLYMKWLDITGHKLLERFGMTEIGMCLSQEYNSVREPGYVGIPLPGNRIKLGEPINNSNEYSTIMEFSNVMNKVEIKINNDITTDPTGELLVKSDTIFKEYYNKPEITQKEFTSDGWFKTGDICQYSLEKNIFKMLGRTSVDIIKTGGYKVSALEIETKLLGYPDIIECAVLGIPDEKWGEVIAAVVVLKPEKVLSIDSLKSWAKDNMTSYSVPKIFKTVDLIPKNAMGKINKKDLKIQLFSK